MSENAASPPRRRILVAGLVGNAIEWYDFAVYGYFATVIGRQFFPSDDPAISLIAAFGAFAAGFLVKPLGGLVFGRVADLVGRQHALILSVIAMALPTVLIGLLPTHQTIGIAAPIAIIALRIVQGLSVGGEYTNSLVFLVEHAPPHRRAFYAIWGQWGAVLGILLGSGVGSLLATILDDAQIASWGWRLPFLLGVLVAVSGYLIRSGIQAEEPPAEVRRPVYDSFGKHRMSVLRVVLLNVGFGPAFYTAFVYAVSYIKEIDRLPEGVALDLNTGSMALLLVIMPLAAWLSGPRRTQAAARDRQRAARLWRRALLPPHPCDRPDHHLPWGARVRRRLRHSQWRNERRHRRADAGIRALHRAGHRLQRRDWLFRRHHAVYRGLADHRDRQSDHARILGRRNRHRDPPHGDLPRPRNVLCQAAVIYLRGRDRRSAAAARVPP